MNPALTQALIVLTLIPPTTWLVHRGIQRDAARWERHQQLMKIAALAPHFRLIQEAMKEAGEAAARAGAKFAAAMKAMQENPR